jgi:hypothetical protein
MCVGAEVTKHLFGSSEGWFAVDNPARNVKLADKVPKGLDLSQASEPALEPELSGGVSLPEGFDELAAEDLTENPYREEELVLVGVYPVDVISRQTARRDDTVNVWMML